MKKLTSVLVLSAMAFTSVPVFAQNPLEISTTPATCRCAVIPDKSTLAPTSIAADIQNDWVVVTLNQPANVQGADPNDGASPVAGLQVWLNGAPATVSSPFLNGSEFSLAVKFQIKNAAGQVVNLDTNSLIDVAYTPVAGKNIVGRYNPALTLGAIPKTKVQNGLKGDAECPTFMKYRFDEYVNGNMIGLGVSEPLTNNSGGALDLTLNGVPGANNNLAAVAGVTIATMSLAPVWPDLTPTDVVTVAAKPGNNFKDHAGNSMCVEAPKTLEVIPSGSGTPVVDTVAPKLAKTGILGNLKIFKASGGGAAQKIPTFVAYFDEPLKSDSVFWANLEKGSVWVKFTVNPANPTEMYGKSYFKANFAASEIGVLAFKNILMADVKDLAGNKMTIQALQQAMTTANLPASSVGGPAVVLAATNYSGALKASIRGNSN